MKVLEQCITPYGTKIRLEDWSSHNTENSNLYGLEINVFFVSKKDNRKWKRGDEYTVQIPYNPFIGYTNDDVIKDYESLKVGSKKVCDIMRNILFIKIMEENGNEND
jgi:hypothetical protein